MFFRREKPHEPSFDERIANLKKYGFETQNVGGGRVRVSRQGIAAVVTDVPGQHPHVDRAGLVMGNDIGILTHGGYQMFFATPDGKRRPALAEQLKALHEFEEDLREGLGLVSLYNLSLGTICGLHLYDRVEERDHGGPVKPFINKPAGVTS
jgi:hypothetical protein